MESILPFLSALKKNNDRDWFQANKKSYETAKKELATFVDKLLVSLSKEDPSLRGLTSKDCLFRIFRDVRFSADKSPYKTNMGAVIAPGGRKSAHACYYVHIEPGGSFLAGGIYMPMPDVLKNIRQEIDFNLDDLQKILQKKSFSSFFEGMDQEEKLKTNPKGYTSDNPAIDYLKLKSFTVSHPLSDKEITTPDLLKKCETVFREIRPLNAFLNTAIPANEK